MKRVYKQIGYNYSVRREAVKYIVVHDTGNTSEGADASAHYSYFNTGNRGSSADIFIDGTSVWYVNDYSKYYTWHCGDGRGRYGITNSNSIGVEICVNSDGDYEAALKNAAAVIRELMEELDIPHEQVVRHYDASRKSCPAGMMKNNWQKWHEFKQTLKESEGLTMTQYEELKAELQKLKPMVYDYIDDNMPDWAKPTIQKLVSRGILKGDEESRLNLTYDMLRIVVMLDRAGAFD